MKVRTNKEKALPNEEKLERSKLNRSGRGAVPPESRKMEQKRQSEGLDYGDKIS